MGNRNTLSRLDHCKGTGHDLHLQTPSSHACHSQCLGPLSFHPQTHGSQITMHPGLHRVERRDTFRDGLVFTSRPVALMEHVILRVEESEGHWQGALRLGFTTHCPSCMNPDSLPPFACPNLKGRPGFWVGAIPEECARQGDRIAYWVNKKGELLYRVNSGETYLLLRGVNVNSTLWGLMDVYGQTRALQILGSTKRSAFGTQTSCPRNTPFDRRDTPVNPEPRTGGAEDCVVCLSSPVSTVLACGHACMCVPCAENVWDRIGTCPLCRKLIAEITITGSKSERSQLELEVSEKQALRSTENLDRLLEQTRDEQETTR
ncbi:E3 ubiquitin-protein ligase NEURL3-like [Acipenser ruthenus]|uniref:E3 ubiquitin-protein ligase NEURL3-like n=1 Tax=Acipenser ruthenus TaxID=7906 RepID=UPI00274210BD|nr:E3 ubiquitin-protein ligase NEURL3-like [Acipenser ruthenus]